VPGAADKSYGIHVAQLAGVPRTVNDRAREVLQWLEAQHESADGAGAASTSKSRPASNGHVGRSASNWQLTLFGLEEHPLLEEIRAANLNDMRPLEALQLLQTWQQRLVDEQSVAKR
jgi:DNA mismatch repair protein MutS